MERFRRVPALPDLPRGFGRRAGAVLAGVGERLPSRRAADRRGGESRVMQQSIPCERSRVSEVERSQTMRHDSQVAELAISSAGGRRLQPASSSARPWSRRLGGLLFGFDTVVISGTNETLQKVFDLGTFWLGFTVAIAPIGTIIGSICHRQAVRRVRPQECPVRPGDLLFCLRPGLRAGTRLVGVAVCPVSRRIGDRRGVGGHAHVHRRDFAAPAPRPAGDGQPTQHRDRGVAVVRLELRDCPALSLRRGLAVDARTAGDPVGHILPLDLQRSGKPAQPGEEGDGRPRRSECSNGLARRTWTGNWPRSRRRWPISRDACRSGCSKRRYWRLVFLACAMAVFNQLTGINAILYYAPNIFRIAGAQRAAIPCGNRLLIGGTLLLFTIVAMFIIDRFGRRILIADRIGGHGPLPGLAGRRVFHRPHGHGRLVSVRWSVPSPFSPCRRAR